MLENLNPNMIRATDVTCCVLTRGTTKATNVNVGPGKDTEQDILGREKQVPECRAGKRRVA